MPLSPVDRLLGWFADGSLLRPDPAEPNTVDLSQALAVLSGVALPRTPNVELLTGRIGLADHLVFVLIDGLGVDVLRRLPETAFLRRHLALELRSVFPSATASALTSLTTGRWPSAHGIPGWWTYLPERDLMVTTLPFVERWSNAALDLPVRTLFPGEPLLPRFQRHVASILPTSIADSAYSRYVRGPTATIAYDSPAGGVDATLAHVRGAAGPTYTYFYLSSIDALSHHHGPRSQEVLAHALELDAQVARLVDALPDGARVAVSADHGLVDVPQERKRLLTRDDPFVSLLRAPPSGEPRSPLLHVRPGRAAEVRARFEERFGDAFTLLDADDAFDLGLFGPDPPSAEARARVGDFLAVARGPDVLLYRHDTEPTGTERLHGYHGGLLPAEVTIPLVLA